MKKPVHFRRCHICGHVNEHARPIQKCGNCNKSLAPFYYFDEKFIPVLSDFNMRPPSIQGAYGPIQGLTAYWETF